MSCLISCSNWLLLRFKKKKKTDEEKGKENIFHHFFQSKSKRASNKLASTKGAKENMPIHHAERTWGTPCHKTFAVLKGSGSFTEEDPWPFMYTMEYSVSVTKEPLGFSPVVIVNLSREYHYILATIYIFFLGYWQRGCLAGTLIAPAVCILHSQKIHPCVFASSR